MRSVGGDITAQRNAQARRARNRQAQVALVARDFNIVHINRKARAPRCVFGDDKGPLLLARVIHKQLAEDGHCQCRCCVWRVQCQIVAGDNGQSVNADAADEGVAIKTLRGAHDGNTYHAAAADGGKRDILFAAVSARCQNRRRERCCKRRRLRNVKDGDADVVDNGDGDCRARPLRSCVFGCGDDCDRARFSGVGVHQQSVAALAQIRGNDSAGDVLQRRQCRSAAARGVDCRQHSALQRIARGDDNQIRRAHRQLRLGEGVHDRRRRGNVRAGVVNYQCYGEHFVLRGEGVVKCAHRHSAALHFAELFAVGEQCDIIARAESAAHFVDCDLLQTRALLYARRERND